MADRRKSIFNWNHISDKLTEDQISELKALYKFYHKKYWLFRITFKYFKKAELICNIGSVPCKNGTGILAGSWQDPAKIPTGIPPRFWPPGFLPGFLVGGGIPGGQNLGGIPAGILPGFLAGGGIPGGQNLGGIPAGILAGFLAGDGIPGGQNLDRIPAGILPGFLAGSRIPAAKISAGFRRESCRDSW